VHGWWCRRRGVTARLCAHGDCRRPGLYRHETAVQGEDGLWRYVFCTRRHRRAWAHQHMIPIT
jgi:hypothetical protein